MNRMEPEVRLSEDELHERMKDALRAVGGTHQMWRHVKTGRRYVVRRVGLRENDLTPLVMYGRAGDPLTWCRSLDEFLDGRFERVS